MDQLFHFSDRGDIACFEPRPVRVPAARPPGQAWLNGPLVWAIDDAHQPLYLFPRDCPCILYWATAATIEADRRQWLGDARMVACIEERWLPIVSGATIFRYALPAEYFVALNDAGMWVSRAAVTPLSVEAISDLPGALAGTGVELRALPRLRPLHALWSTTLHASGIRLRQTTG